jgi:hypothetical protein
MKDGGFLGGIYGMAFIGAAVYYLQHAATFWACLVSSKPFSGLPY